MSHQSELIAQDIDAYLALHERKEMLRFLTCGSVDDGKSTLIGRLLYDSKMIYEDTLATIRKDSTKHGTTGGDDFALLTDGLEAEREQGITIDVAYQYFSTAKRKFIIADTPGHEQYTRNMVTGASTADLAIILIDARPGHGVLEQTKRHTFITSLLGIKHVVIAVNKMDLVDFSEERFEEIVAQYKEFASRLELPDQHFIPIAALHGDNLVDASKNMPWYKGSTLMYLLESVNISSDRNLTDFRMPVQMVNRPNLDFRGFCGTIASGIIRKGDEVMSLPSRKKSRVERIVTFDGDLDEAFAPLSVTITLEDEIDSSRGDMLVKPLNVPQQEQKFDATIVWMDEEAMVPGKQYLIKHTSKLVSGTINTLRYQIDVNTLHRKDSPTLSLNQIGRCEVLLNEPIAYDPYRVNRSTGAFIIVDRISNVTVGAGMILARTTSETTGDHWDDEPATGTHEEQFSAVTSDERQARFGQKPATLLLTGLSGAGKTTIGFALERRLFEMGRACTMLDGQDMRQGISRDLGFTADDRSENLRRGVEVARLMNKAGLICICGFLAPREEIRQKAAEAVGTDRFLTVHLAAPIEVCRERDQEGLYGDADSGKISNFPGVSSKYEEPSNPELVLPTHEWTVEQSVDALVELLKSRGFIS